MQPQHVATVETDLFEHRQVQPHFINDCCFGEDFANWLIARLAHLSAQGFALSEPIQEDYGWGFWAKRGKENFWIAISYAGDGPTEAPAEWVISLAHDFGLNVFKMLFKKPDYTALDTLRSRIRRELESEPRVRIVDDA